MASTSIPSTPSSVTPGTPPDMPGAPHEYEMQQHYGTRARAERFYRDQVLDHLNAGMREFVARQEMLFVATSDRLGECDATFRAGPPGFVLVVDEHRLAWPEYRGNGVMASLANLGKNPHAGLLFIDFTESLIGLHVNGRAQILTDEAMRDGLASVPEVTVPGQLPQQWVLLNVEEAYIHCAKHIPRLRRVPHERVWGTDDMRRKGGDFFGAKAGRDAPGQ
ncbi:pyridoxamine 5'-phosphate oxidase family protein [Streptomyces roseoverticillatus]|uniref:Pyridoxamine 5'-phosphate oxidase family protein n=1 Tax=Streptomyces roseoverticillatus TaxID=66429 RepID=A0ABV3J209_9ACTN